MKKIFCAVLLTGIGTVTYAQTKKPIAKKPIAATQSVPNSTLSLKNGIDSASYAFASSIGSGLKSSGITHLNYEVFLKGLKDAFTGGKLALDQQKAQQAINKALEEANKAKFKTNITEGKSFLEQNKKRAGVMSTASGIQYEILKAGDGIKPKVTDSVTVHYKGTLLNGQQFDSSYDRNQPTTFALGQVIIGWIEALQLMPTGAKYKFYIPYNLAYGERGAGQNIPPYSTLVFDIELLKVNGK